eukprot:4914562-Pleurochrysis_carterae.AAC.1
MLSSTSTGGALEAGVFAPPDAHIGAPRHGHSECNLLAHNVSNRLTKRAVSRKRTYRRTRLPSHEPASHRTKSQASSRWPATGFEHG